MADGWGIVMMLGMLGIWVLVALAIVWMVRSTRVPGAMPTLTPGSGSTGVASTGHSERAEQILAERLARGDIDPEEYSARLDALASRKAFS